MTRLILIVAAALALAACNTIKGVGQDIQKAGSAIEGAAKK
jgi:entericidin B